MRIPQTPFEVSVVEILAMALGLRLFVDPSMPVSLGLLALAGAWTLEKIFVSHARVHQNSSIDARDSAVKAAESAALVAASVAALESRLVRLETREGWRTDGQTRR